MIKQVDWKQVRLLLVLFLFTAVIGWSQKTTQKQVRDLEVWSSATLKWQATKKLSFELEEQLRLKEDASELDIYFTELGTSYKINKHFGAGIGGRYITENDNKGKKQGYRNHFRYHIDLSYKHKLKRFGLKYRVRYQSKNELGDMATTGNDGNRTIRLKTSLSYNIKKTKWSPSIAGEIFRKTQEEETEFNKYRLTAMMGYKFKKLGELGFFYRMERELNANAPKTSNIVGAKYIYTIKRKKKNKKV